MASVYKDPVFRVNTPSGNGSVDNRTAQRYFESAFNGVNNALGGIVKRNDLEEKKAFDALTGNYMDQIYQGKNPKLIGNYDAQKIAEARWKYSEKLKADALANSRLGIARRQVNRAGGEKTMDTGGFDFSPLPWVESGTPEITTSSIGSEGTVNESTPVLASNKIPFQDYSPSPDTENVGSGDMLMAAIDNTYGVDNAISDSNIPADKVIPGQTPSPVRLASADNTFIPDTTGNVLLDRAINKVDNTALINNVDANDPAQVAQMMMNVQRPEPTNTNYGARTASVSPVRGEVPKTKSKRKPLVTTVPTENIGTFPDTTQRDGYVNGPIDENGLNQNGYPAYTPVEYPSQIKQKLSRKKAFDDYATKELLRYRDFLTKKAGNSIKKQKAANAMYKNAETRFKNQAKRYTFTPDEQAAFDRIKKINDIKFMRSQGIENGKPISVEKLTEGERDRKGMSELRDRLNKNLKSITGKYMNADIDDTTVTGLDEIISNPSKYGVDNKYLPELKKTRDLILSRAQQNESYIYQDYGEAAERKAQREAANAVRQSKSLIDLNNKIQNDIESGAFSTGPIDTTVQKLSKYIPKLGETLGYSKEEMNKFIENTTQIGGRLVQYVKEISGAAVTDKERKAIYDIMTGGEYANERQMATALAQWSRDVVNRRTRGIDDNLFPASKYISRQVRIPEANRNVPAGMPSGTTVEDGYYIFPDGSKSKIK